jgi:hypothetical protein
MNRATSIVRWNNLGTRQVFAPTTLDRLGKDEKFLEDTLAANPELLGIQSRRSGIRGPYAVFQQVTLATPAGRTIYPDIVLLTGSGHLVVVEVKLSVNPELRDRHVIAQIIDYVSSFAALDEQRLLKVLCPLASPHTTWADFVASVFPSEDQVDELAGLLGDRAANGEVNLVIACDRTPPGVDEIVAGIATQQTTGFDLDLVEVAPYVAELGEPNEIVFVPSIRLSTEIVARTAVTITYREGDAVPSAAVETTSITEIERNKEAATGAASTARVWSHEEVEEAFRRDGNPVLLRLMEFSKQHSADGQIVSPAVKSNATFGFYIRGRKRDGRGSKLMFFYTVLGWDDVWMYLKQMRGLISPEAAPELDQRLAAISGAQIDINRIEPRLKIEAVGQHQAEFEQLLLWLKDQAAIQAATAASDEAGALAGQP